MKKIQKNGTIYAIYDSLNTLEKGSIWYGEKTDGIQVSRMSHDKGKSFKAHIHKFNPRSLNYTQECIIVIKGKIEFSFYDENKVFLDKVILNSDDMIISYKGYHGAEVLKNNTVFFEIKNGPFIDVDADKEFMIQ